MNQIRIHYRLTILLLLSSVLFGLGLAGPSRPVLGFAALPDDIPASEIIDPRIWPTEPAVLDHRDLGAPEPLRDRLLNVMAAYRDKTWIPYVWGGSRIGTQAECQACSTCLEANRRLHAEKRARGCESCRKCGMDCSHFVNRVYREAGFSYPYMSTRRLSRLGGARSIVPEAGFVDMGRDLSRARPGDLLVHQGHVVLLVRRTNGVHGDILHVSRSIKNGRIGGVEYRREVRLDRFRGSLRKILRWHEIHQEDRHGDPLFMPDRKVFQTMIDFLPLPGKLARARHRMVVL